VAAVGYIPKGKSVGLSKLARCVEFFARRLQNQERITQQVANELSAALGPKGVGVVLKARHLCMEQRGVRAHDVYTTTTCLLGCIKEDARTRSEFLEAVRKGM
jgi:GTP cyclohydrolase I